MSRRLAPLAGLVLLAAASTLPAQEWRGRARIEGTVKSTKGEPIAGAKVSLRWTKSGKGGPDVTTGKNGHWTYFGLAGGGWDIDFEASGYQTRKISANFEEGARNQPIDVQLEPVPEAQASHEELQVAGKRISPETAAAIESGNTAMASKNWGAARENYQKALQEMPDFAPLYMSVAKTYAGEGNDAEAIAWARKAAEKNPQDGATWKTIAELELSRGNLDAGREALAKVPADQITDTSYLNLGILLYNKKQNAAAEEAFGKALELTPDLADAYSYRGLARMQLKRNAEAKADFQKYLELAPDGSEADTVKELLKSLQ
ncbi:MAG: tetratricopeptide repeat protein [Thermoanaerobaculia bacterium]